jgi:hypothetical protein
MHIRLIRTLLFGFVVLSLSAASYAQIGVAIKDRAAAAACL